MTIYNDEHMNRVLLRLRVMGILEGISIYRDIYGSSDRLAARRSSGRNVRRAEWQVNIENSPRNNFPTIINQFRHVHTLSGVKTRPTPPQKYRHRIGCTTDVNLQCCVSWWCWSTAMLLRWCGAVFALPFHIMTLYTSELIDAGRKIVSGTDFDVYLSLRTPNVTPRRSTGRQTPIYRNCRRITITLSLRITLFIIYTLIYHGESTLGRSHPSQLVSIWFGLCD